MVVTSSTPGPGSYHKNNSLHVEGPKFGFGKMIRPDFIKTEPDSPGRIIKLISWPV